MEDTDCGRQGELYLVYTLRTVPTKQLLHRCDCLLVKRVTDCGRQGELYLVYTLRTVPTKQLSHRCDCLLVSESLIVEDKESCTWFTIWGSAPQHYINKVFYLPIRASVKIFHLPGPNIHLPYGWWKDTLTTLTL